MYYDCAIGLFNLYDAARDAETSIAVKISARILVTCKEY